RYATDVPGDDRKPTSKRLGDDHAVSLSARCQHQGVRLCVRAVELVVRERAGEAHPIAEAPVLGEPSQVCDEPLVEIQRADADAFPGAVVDRGQCVEQEVMAL